MKQQTEVKTLKEGKFVIIDDEPCTIVSVQHSKPGKHGAAKARVDAIGLFDGAKRSIVQPVDAKIYVPIVERKTAQVLSVAGSVAQLMDTTTFATFELTIPDELQGKVTPGTEVPYLTSMGKTKFSIRQ